MIREEKFSVFKPVLALVFVLITLMESHVNARELPNMCSRDQNMNEFTILSYHEIADKGETLDTTYTVSPSNFDQQIHWLIDNGYHFINVDYILKYRQHGKPLPDKAVLITFDDGYQSVYENAYPIIKKYKIPTVIALVGSWLKSKDKVKFGDQIINRDKFLGQKEIKEMVASGLVEIGSHSYDLHQSSGKYGTCCNYSSMAC